MADEKVAGEMGQLAAICDIMESIWGKALAHVDEDASSSFRTAWDALEKEKKTRLEKMGEDPSTGVDVRDIAPETFPAEPQGSPTSESEREETITKYEEALESIDQVSTVLDGMEISHADLDKSKARLEAAIDKLKSEGERSE